MSVCWSKTDNALFKVAINGVTVTATEALWHGGRTFTGYASGKWYWEITPDIAELGSGTNVFLGVATEGVALTGNDITAGSYLYNGGNGNKADTSSVAYGDSYGVGDTISFAFDIDAGKIWFGKNGVWQASGDPANGTNPTFSGIPIERYFPYFLCYVAGNRVTANFGASDFAYTPPSGFVSFPIPGTDIVGNDEYTKLLIHSDTTDGSTVFTDSSLSAHTITANGDTHHEADQKKFGATSIYFDGSDDYLSIPDSSDFDFGVFAFTIDFWVMRNRSNTREMLFGQCASSGEGSSISIRLEIEADNTINLYMHNVTYSSSYVFNNITNFAHFAIVRNGVDLLFFVDGILKNTFNIGANSLINATTDMSFGRQGEYDGLYFNGYLDEIRISKGIARWTEDFTPSSSPYVRLFNPDLVQSSNIFISELQIDENLVNFPLIIALEEIESSVVDEITMPIISETFAGTVLDSEIWDTNIVPDASVTVNNALELNNLSTGAHSGAAVITKQLFKTFGEVILETKWMPHKDSYQSAAGPIISFHAIDSTRESNYGINENKSIQFFLFKRGSDTTDRTSISILYLLADGSSWAGTLLEETAIDIDETLWHTLRITMNWENGAAEINLNSGEYVCSAEIPLQCIRDIGDSFVVELSTSDYSKNNTEKFKDLAFYLDNRKKFAVTTDVVDEFTKLLIHSDTTNGSTVFTDSSLSNHEIIAVGDAQHSVGQKKFGASAIKSSAGVGNRLDIANTSDFNFGAEDFTIDWWEFRTSSGNGETVFTTSIERDHAGLILGYNSNGVNYCYFSSNGTSWEASEKTLTPSVLINEWAHYAVVRQGDEIFLFTNGVLQSSFPYTAIIYFNDTEHTSVGASAYGAPSVSVDEFRVSKGIARWTSNFTPPNQPYSEQYQLPVEIECWEESRHVIHTKIPTVFSEKQTKCNMVVDSAQDDNIRYVGETGSLPAQEVWDDNFVAVYHMAQDPSGVGACILDSTSGERHGIPTGSMTSGDLIDGPIGKGLDFDGVDDVVTVPYDVAMADLTSAYTLDSFFNPTSDADFQCVFSNVNTNSLASIQIAIAVDTLGVYAVCGGTYATRGDLPDVNTDYLYTMRVADTNNFEVFNNGESYHTETRGLSNVGDDWYIGDFTGQLHYDGQIYELRMSKVARSDAWIKATNASLKGLLLLNKFNVEIAQNFHTFLIIAGSIDENLYNFPIMLDVAQQCPDLFTTLSEKSLKIAATGVVPSEYTKLLIHSDTTDGSTVFTDSSLSAHTITANGDAHHEVDQKKFGATSIYFDGSGDYLSIPDSSDFAFEQTDFTVDFYYYPTVFNSNQYLYDFGKNSGTFSLVNGELRYYNPTTGTGSVLYASGHILTINTWVHLAIVRAVGVTSLYADGIQVIFGDDAYNYEANKLSIGQYGNGGYSPTGYIDEFRVSKGIARWTEDFTPPSSPYSFGVVEQYPIEIECWEKVNICKESYTIGLENATYLGGAFDGVLDDANASGSWYAYDSTYVPTGWTGQFLPVAQTVVEYAIFSSGVNTDANPKDWTFEGSQNGVDWTTLDTRADEILPALEFTVYSFLNTVAYLYYRLNVSANNGNSQYLIISEIEMRVDMAVLHTKIPFISSTVDTEFKLFWDDTQLDNNDYVGETGSLPAQEVWDDNFVAVYHMAQDPSGGTDCILDSTNNINHGTPNGSMTSDDLVDGEIGKALDFDGSDDYININNVLENTELSEYTVEIQMKTEESGSDHDSILFSAHASNDDNKLRIANNNYVRVHDIVSNENYDGVTVINTGLWWHIAVASDGSNSRLYVDGSLDAGPITHNVSLPSNGKMSIGQEYDPTNTPGDFAQMVSSVVRISNIARSAAWIKATNASLKGLLFGVINIVGVVTEDSTYVARVLRLYNRETGDFIAETISSAIDGVYSFQVNDEITEYYIVALDDAAGTDYNALIQDRLTGSH